MASKKTIEALKSDMLEAGTWQPYLRYQLEDTADTIDTIKSYQRKIKEEPVIDEMKTNGVDMKKTQHPLISAVAALKKVLVIQLAALGLNRNAQKKAESDMKPQRQEEATDPLTELLTTANSALKR